MNQSMQPQNQDHRNYNQSVKNNASNLHNETNEDDSAIRKPKLEQHKVRLVNHKNNRASQQEHYKNEARPNSNTQVSSQSSSSAIKLSHILMMVCFWITIVYYYL